jgi:hypothetical protein
VGGRGGVVMLDVISGRIADVFSSDTFGIILGNVSADNREIFVSYADITADIWMINLK